MNLIQNVVITFITLPHYISQSKYSYVLSIRQLATVALLLRKAAEIKGRTRYKLFLFEKD